MPPFRYRSYEPSWAVVLVAVFILPLGLGLPWPVFALLAVVTVLAGFVFGTWLRVEVGAPGVEMTWRTCWLVPFKRAHWWLDVRVEDYWSFDADAAEGLLLSPPWGWGEEESACFGPAKDEPRLALITEMRSALVRARAALPQGPRALHFAQLEPSLEVTGREFSSSGRLLQGRLAAELVIAGLTLPVGTALTFNSEGWLDPRRPDLLRTAVLSSPLAVAGVEAAAGARLHFNHRLLLTSVDHIADGPVTVQGRFIDGSHGFSVDERVMLSGFKAAQALVISGVTLPAGTHFHRWAVGDAGEWYANPPAPLQLPEFAAENVLVSRDFTRITSGFSKGFTASDGTRFHHGALPLLPSLSIDRRRAKRRGQLTGRRASRSRTA